jgi:hypothetical protein
MLLGGGGRGRPLCLLKRLTRKINACRDVNRCYFSSWQDQGVTNLLTDKILDRNDKRDRYPGIAIH